MLGEKPRKKKHGEKPWNFVWVAVSELVGSLPARNWDEAHLSNWNWHKDDQSCMV
jgi:hypothetical protein